LSAAHLLLDALDALTGSLQLHDVLDRLVKIVRVIEDRPRASVFLWNDRTAILELAASDGEPRVEVGHLLKIADASPYMRRAVSTRSSVLADFAAIPADARGAAGSYLVESMIVPLVRADTLLGVLTVDETRSDHPFSQRESGLIERVAAQAAVAVENARLYESQRRLAHVSDTLAQLSIAVSTQALDDAMPDLLETSAGLIGASGAILARRVSGGWSTEYNYGAQGLKAFYTDEESAARSRMAATHTAQHVPDVFSDPDLDPRIAAQLGYRSYVSLPLLLQDRIVGALSFLFSDTTPGFDETTWMFFERLEYIVASALESRRLFDELNRRADYANALNRINDAVHSTLQFDEILGRVVVETAHAAGVDATAIHICEAGRWRFTHTYGLPKALSSARLTNDQAPISMAVVNGRETLVLDDIAADERFRRSIVTDFNIAAIIAVPLLTRDSVTGVLFAGCYNGPSRFDRDQVDFMVKVGNTVSLAMENARLYEGEHRIAETLQHALLAVPEHVQGVRFAHAYRSASEAASVGGDFYDVFELDPDTVGVLVGDIAGKGLEAAVLTSLLKNTIRAHAAERPRSPAEAIALTNDMVLKVTPPESFATVFFAALDRRSGEVAYTNAGHPTAFIRRASGAVDGLASNSPLVGGLPEPGFDQDFAVLNPGDVLLMYTDGVTEARSGDQFYGQARVADTLSRTQVSDPASAVRGLIEDVLSFTGNRLSDDVAVLAVMRDEKGLESRAAQAVEVPADGHVG
jgi:serine phosphatase RsbU (regulator of sigma subunit)